MKFLKKWFASEPYNYKIRTTIGKHKNGNTYTFITRGKYETIVVDGQYKGSKQKNAHYVFNETIQEDEWITDVNGLTLKISDFNSFECVNEDDLYEI